jgi:hypothetical protein
VCLLFFGASISPRACTRAWQLNASCGVGAQNLQKDLNPFGGSAIAQDLASAGDANLAMPALPDSVLDEVIPGTIRNAESFVRYMKSVVMHLQVGARVCLCCVLVVCLQGFDSCTCPWHSFSCLHARELCLRAGWRVCVRSCMRVSE